NWRRPVPGSMIARIHYFHVKETILRLARQQFPLRHKDKPIYIFPDYPAEVMRQRQDAGVRCGVLYPARLRVTIGSTDKTFSSPRDAEVFAETLQSH
uniref:L1 transposable element RRM domain-containing protein n=1 Tax=Poecilia latipinna TaxID=48699 RepID=A0A3B3UPJ3_9TELE